MYWLKDKELRVREEKTDGMEDLEPQMLCGTEGIKTETWKREREIKSREGSYDKVNNDLRVQKKRLKKW